MRIMLIMGLNHDFWRSRGALNNSALSVFSIVFEMVQLNFFAPCPLKRTFVRLIS